MDLTLADELVLLGHTTRSGRRTVSRSATIGREIGVALTLELALADRLARVGEFAVRLVDGGEEFGFFEAEARRVDRRGERNLRGFAEALGRATNYKAIWQRLADAELLVHKRGFLSRFSRGCTLVPDPRGEHVDVARDRLRAAVRAGASPYRRTVLLGRLLASAQLEATLLQLPTVGRRLDARLKLQSLVDVDPAEPAPDSAWVLARLERMLNARYASTNPAPSGT